MKNNYNIQDDTVNRDTNLEEDKFNSTIYLAKRRFILRDSESKDESEISDIEDIEYFYLFS